MQIHEVLDLLVKWNSKHRDGGPLRLVTHWGEVDTPVLFRAWQELEDAHDAVAITDQDYFLGRDFLEALKALKTSERRVVFRAFWEKARNERDWVV